jgi:two-component system OmpR family sensor kinase/two-component system sensor histidine kinase BaeS
MRKRRFLLVRFALAFGAVLLIYLLVLAVVLAMVYRPLHESLSSPGLLVLVICGLPFGVTLLVATAAGITFRRIGSPLVDVMAAADAVADGDFRVRVRETGPGEFARLARSFNRMTAELERAEQQRRNLTADVAHELRSPLHIIQGNLEGILDGVYQPTPEHISATLEETRLLSRLVSDLQTLSLTEAGQLPLHRIRVSARDLLEDVALSFSGQAAQAGVSMQVKAGVESDGLALEVDPDRMDQVLTNLVANALRHTPPGGQIHLRAAPIAGEDGTPGVRLSVQDSGVGIPAEDLPYIFDRFWRGDRSRTRSEGAGSGLGLAIARQLVQAHGGRIFVESRPGAGTAFHIDLETGSTAKNTE